MSAFLFWEYLILDWNTQVNILFIHCFVWSYLCFEVYKVWFLACNHKWNSLLPTLKHTNISSGAFMFQHYPSMDTRKLSLSEVMPRNHSLSTTTLSLVPVCIFCLSQPKPVVPNLRFTLEWPRKLWKTTHSWITHPEILIHLFWSEDQASDFLKTLIKKPGLRTLI